MSRQKLGQHFLHSPAWRERIARTLLADANATWLEIGPGHGEMTEFLAQRAPRVIAVETDAALASTLRQRAAGLPAEPVPLIASSTFVANLPAKAAASAATAGWPNVEIVEADILSVDLAELINKSFSVYLRKGTAFYPACPDEGSEERTAAAPPVDATTGPSGPGASPETRERAPLRQGTVLTVPTEGSPAAPSGAEGSPAAPRAHEALGIGFVGRGFSRDKTARSHSRALAHGGHTENDAQPSTKERLRIYGNLPYYITSPILSHLFRFAAQIDSIHIVIQWEVAARIVATPGHREYAYLSALCQYFARPEIVLRIPPGAFRPPPKVNSALVTMNLPGERAQLHIRDDAAFLKFLQNCFSQKRKTLRNNLKSLFADSQIAAALATCALAPKARAEEMSLAQFAQLHRRLSPEE